MFWSIFEAFAQILLSIIPSVALGRLLEPEVYGSGIVLLIIVQFSTVCVDTFLNDAIIQSTDGRETLQPTGVWISTTIGLFIYLLLSITSIYHIAPSYSSFAWQAAIISIPIQALSSSPLAILRREFRFQQIARATLLARALAGVASVTAAFIIPGIWAFVLLQLVYSTIFTGLILAASSKNRFLGFDVCVAKRIIAFGLKGFGGIVLWHCTNRGVPLLISYFQGATSAAYFAMALRLIETPRDALISGISQFTLSTLVKVKSDSKAWRVEFKRIHSCTTIILAPLFGGGMIMCSSIISLVLGPKWMPSAHIAAILSFGSIFYVSRITYAPAFVSRGRPDVNTLAAILGGILSFSAFLLPIRDNLLAISAFWIARFIPSFLVGLISFSKLGFGEYYWQMSGSIQAVCIAAVALPITACVWNAGFGVQVVAFGAYFVGYVIVMHAIGGEEALECFKLLKAYVASKRIRLLVDQAGS